MIVKVLASWVHWPSQRMMDPETRRGWSFFCSGSFHRQLVSWDWTFKKKVLQTRGCKFDWVPPRCADSRGMWRLQELRVLDHYVLLCLQILLSLPSIPVLSLCPLWPVLIHPCPFQFHSLLQFSLHQNLVQAVFTSTVSPSFVHADSVSQSSLPFTQLTENDTFLNNSLCKINVFNKRCNLFENTYIKYIIIL